MAKKKIATSETTSQPPAAAARKRTGTARTTPASNGDALHHPTHDEIAEAAYHRYLRRQGAGGSDFEDWLEAERELRARSTSDTQQQ